MRRRVAPLIALLVPAVASGQERKAPRDSSEVTLTPVEVRVSIAPTAGMIGSGVPARVSVVDAAKLRDWRARLLPDVLASEPGLSSYDDLGSPWKLNLGMRGFTVGPTVGLPPGITVFLDGVRQNEPDAQQVNFDLLPLEHLARVEVLRGSASLLGANSLGGAINLVTRRGEGRSAGEIELAGGSFGQGAIEGSVGGRTARGVDYFVAGGTERERGWRDATGARNANAFVNIGRAWSPARSLGVQGYAAHARAETAGSLPESIFRTSPRTNFTAGDFEDVSAQQLALTGRSAFAAGEGGGRAFVRRSSAERFNVNQAPDPNVRARTSNVTVGATADWRRVLARVGGGSFALRLGGDGSASRVRARIYNERDGIGIAAADVDAAGLTTDVKSPSIDLAGYAVADYRVGRATLSGGGRYDVVRVPFRNQLRTSDNTTNVYRALSPRIGASVVLPHGGTMYASAGRSFRAPAILELGCADPEAACPLPFALGDDPPLRPVRATTYEVGGEWSPAAVPGALGVTLSLYRTDARHEIFFVASDASIVSGYFTNLDRTRRVGAELGVNGTAVGTRLAWYGTYAWTRATFRTPATLFSVRSDEDFAGSPYAGENAVSVGSRIPLVPAQRATVGASLRAGGGVTLGFDTRITGEQWLRGDEGNETRPLAPYVLTNVRLGYANGGWEVMALVANAFAERRATFGTFNENRESGELERFLTPATGRAFKLVLRRALGAR